MNKLEKMIENLKTYELSESASGVEVTGISYHSGRVKPGYLFVCVQGFHVDGHDFIDQAVANGASVIVVEKEVLKKAGVLYIKVPDTREALSKLSAAFFDYPDEKLNLIGVTGTNGKTTTTYMVESILRHAHLKTGLVGTIRNKIGDEILATERTTPEAMDLFELFYKMGQVNVTHAVMEVSSHALELKRVQDLSFKVGIFTNITQDHLDFHDSLDNYRRAKGKLFKKLTKDGVGVINIDDPSAEYMIEQSPGKVYTYGIDKKADIQASEINVRMDGVSYLVTTPVGKTQLDLQFTGYFNVYNSLAAIGAGLVFEIPLETIKKALESLDGVAGRFELVDCGQEFGVIVDYAHTPDGMENVLTTARNIVQGRVIAVFGCGGDRDRTKRPIMGRVGATHADLCILTSDNPRTEDPLQILKDVEAGILEMDQPVDYTIIPDRREAIFHAIQKANPDDLVIILGKGHETYQIFRDKTIDFDDRAVAREAINSL